MPAWEETKICGNVRRMKNPLTDRPLSLRFWAKVSIGVGCWIWIGGKTNAGYGKLRLGRDCGFRTELAHRIAYEMFHGPLSIGQQIDHLCRVRSCVNPEHLEPVSSRENILRGRGISAQNASKTHCHRGHPLTGDNVYVPPKRPNVRNCKACRKARV